MEWSGMLLVAFGIVALMHSTFADVDADCSDANQDECDGLTGGYCDLDATDGPKCACAAINDGATGGTTCASKDCSTSAGGAQVCTTADANSVCVNDACVCKATFQLTGADDSDVCVATDCSTVTTACDADTNSECKANVCVCKAKFELADDSAVCVAKVIGSSCTADGDCADITDAVCDTDADICSCPGTSTANTDGNGCVPNKIGSSCTATGAECSDIDNSVCDSSGQNPVCACPATTTANTDGNQCVLNVCTDNTTCTTVDANAICAEGKCDCNVGFEISNLLLCQAKVIGSSCTAEGGECAAIAGAICDTSGDSSICACPDTHEANQDGSQCTYKNNGVVSAASMALLFICCLPTFLYLV